MKQKQLIVSIALSTCSLLTAQDKVLMSKNVNLRVHTVSTTELLSTMPLRGHKTHCQKQCEGDPGCIVPYVILPSKPVLQNPNAPAVAFFPNSGASNLLVSPKQSVGLKFLGASPQFSAHNTSTPPDTMGVAGPEQFIIALNEGIISCDKKTGKRDWILNTGPGEFGVFNDDLTKLAPQDNADPRVRYDKFSQRWFISYLNFNRSLTGISGFYIAASDGPVITQCTQWKVIEIPYNTLIPNPEGCIGDIATFLDFPMLGIDKHAAYLTGNMFNSPANTRVGNSIFVIPKEQWLCEDKTVITAFRDIAGVNAVEATAQPADNFDENAQFGYIIQATPYTYGKLNLWRIINPGSDHPSLAGPFELDVPTTAFDATWLGIPEKNNIYGRPGQIQSQDDRPQSVHVRNSQLYTVQSTVVNQAGISLWDAINQRSLGDRVGIRWYQIDLTGDPTGNAGNSENANTIPALVQAGTLFDARDTNAPLSYTMPSIMTNKRGDMVIGTSFSGLNSVVKANFVSRQKNDPLGTLRVGPNYEGTIFAESSGIFTFSLGAFGPAQRWGDYSMTSVDPDDDTTIWTIQEVHRGILAEIWVARLDA